MANDGTIYFTTLYAVFAVNPDGTEKWVRGFLNGNVRNGGPVPLEDGGIVYVRTDGWVTKRDNTGALMWEYHPGGGTSSGIAVSAAGAIYHGSTDGNLYATNPDGTFKWSFAAGGEIQSGVVIGKAGTIYFGSQDQKLYAVSPGGAKVWDLNLGSPVNTTPAIGANGNLYVATYDGKLHSVTSGGVSQWSYQGVQDAGVQPAIAADGTVYFISQNWLYAVNPNGSEKWKFTSDHAFKTPVVLGDGSLYVAGSNGKLFHLDANGGIVREQGSFGQLLVAPAVTSSGRIYVGDLQAFEGGLAPADSSWPMFQHDLARTGRVPPQPAVDLLLPVNSSTYVSGHSVPLRARVLNLPTVDRVDFFRGASLLSSDTSAPFEANWASSGTAAQTFSAVAVSGSLSITSAVASINLLSARPNTLPTVQIVSPTNNASPLAGGELRVSAQANDPDGAVLNVEVFDGNTSVGSAAFPDFNVTINPLTHGEHLLKAVATDNFGGKGTSAVVRAYAVHKKWEYAQPQYSGFRSPALGMDGSVLVGASEWIYALNNTGQETWVRHLGSVAINTLISVATDGTLYFGTSDARLFARHADGTAKWDFPLDGQVIHAPALGKDGTIYTGGSGGKLFAVLPNGTKKWDYTAAGNLSAPPIIGGDGTVYFGTGNGYFTALDETGQFQWEFHVDGGINSAPAIGADGTLYFGSGNAGKFFAVTPEGGQKWMLPINSGVANASPSIDVDGTIYCGSYDGTLLAIRPNGTLKWSLPLGGEVQGTPAVAADGSLYVGNGYGRQFFRISSTGTKIWEFANTSSFDFSPSPLILDSGDVVAATGSQVLVFGGSSGLAGGPWPMFMRNWQHEGRGWELPKATLLSPVAEAQFVTGETVAFTIDTTGSPMPIVSAQYLSNSNVVTTVNASPFGYSWTPPAGVHFVQTRVTDTRGGVILTKPIRIKVVSPGTGPSLLASPVSITTITNGGSAVLGVDVFGSGPLTFTWYRDGVELAGETGSQLVLDAADIADAGKYYVRVSNAFGQTQTAPVAVNVLQPVVARWISPLGAPIHTSPALGKGGIVHYGSDTGGLFAYDPRGSYEWWWQADFYSVGLGEYYDPIRSTPAIDLDGVAHLITRSGVYYRINSDGTELGRTPQMGSDSSPAFGTNGTVYVGAGSTLRAYTPAGNLLWSSGVSGPADSGPAISADGSIYVTSLGVPVANNLYTGTLTAFTPAGGLKWSFVTGDSVVSSPAIGADGTLYFGSRDEKFYAISPNGAKQWEFVTDGPISGSAVVAADGTIYFGNAGAFMPEIGIRKGHLYALHPNGQLKWSFQADGEVNSTPALAADGTIYFGADDWYVYALNPNGTLRWKYWTLGKVQNPLSIGFDGTVYATSVGLYALFENPSPLAAAPWPKFKHDLRNTGNVATTNDAPEWVFPFASNAFNRHVRSILVHGDEVYVGGDFTIAGGRMASHVAKWDGTRWFALGQGVNGSVNALAWYNGALYAGGNFTQAGGQNIPMLARWNGTAWSAVGLPINDFVTSLVVHEGLLYIAGYFSQLDGQPVGSILAWDGTNLSDTGLGNSGLSRTTALANLGGSLYAGVSALGPPENRSYGVVRRTATGWEEVARGLNNHIYSLAVYGGQLYVGGEFTHASGASASGIVRWTGSDWAPLPEALEHYLNPAVLAMVVWNGDLYVTGGIMEADGERVNSLARWNGTSWSPLGTGLTRGHLSGLAGASALAVQDDSLLIGGNFLSAGGNREIRYFARWRNGTFEAIGDKLSFEEGRFRLTLFRDLGVSYGIEVSTNLVDWERIVTFTGQEEAEAFIDEDSAQYPQRFYRAVSP